MTIFPVRWARRHPVTAYFLAVYAVTWLVWVPRALVHWGLLDWTWILVVARTWSYGPALAALAVAAVVGGGPEVRRLGRALVRWRVGWRWWSVAVLGPFALSGTGLLLHERLTAVPARWSVDRPAALLVVPELILILALTDGLGEEPGWRGFALPRLQARLGPAAASVLLGVVWAAWHLPLIWTRGAPLEGQSFPMLLLALVPTSVLFSWVFNHARGSVLVAVVLHATHNLAGPSPPRPNEGVFSPFLLVVAVKWALVLVVLVADPNFRLRSARDAAPATAPAPVPPV